jgi:hypothetical protein
LIFYPIYRRNALTVRLFLVLLGSVICGLVSSPGNCAQNNSHSARVQVLSSYLDPGEREIYLLTDLKRGDELYIYMHRLSGNLDPLFALANGQFEIEMFDKELSARLKETPHSPYNVFRDLLDSFYLAWDDDSGKGTDAALKFSIPSDGNYKVVVAGSRQPMALQITGQTFGSYRLIVGINAPEVLIGNATSFGPAFASLVYSPSSLPQIQEVTGKLTLKNNATYYKLTDIDPGSTLYVQAEATSGDLKPALSLRNYGNKTIRVDNWQGIRNTALLHYTFKEPALKNSLVISGSVEQSKATSGDFRLRIGINAPGVLEGKGLPTGRPIILQPIHVGVGLHLDQITQVNQREENFGAVGNLTLQWQDPAFAFNPDTCECPVKVLDSAQFHKFVSDNNLRWPRFVFFNQQGNRWTQGDVFRIYPDGNVTYYERFSVTLQAPDFNFKRFPLDTQTFYIRLQCLNPEEDYQFTELPKLTAIGEQLGEEEWYITNHDTGVTSIVIGDDDSASQYYFRFLCQRHLSYYVFRIFIPLLLIITVSWVIFFLKDYAKRVDISGANLLVFIAFNFTIASDLPRLGYLTFLDRMLIVAFVLTTFTVIGSVAMKRLDTTLKTELAQKIDRYILWGYPILYILGVLLLSLISLFQ